MNDIQQQALALKEQIVADRRYLHKHPEIALDLPVTTAYVEKRLREMGYEPKRCGKSGIIADVGKTGGKTILLRGDMDALPMQEKSGLDFTSVADGSAHTCGHDCHTAMLLGAAQLLKNNEDKLQGMVRLMFQPAEETLEGAQEMIENGVLQSPKPDAAFAIHVAAPAPVGVVGYCPGNALASSDLFEITVTGVGCHGAAPETGIDPINAAAHIHIALQELLAREIPASQAVALTIGKFQAGHTLNVVPDTAVLGGTLRTFSSEIREFAKKRIEEISAGTAAVFRAKASVNYIRGVPPLFVNENLLTELNGYVSELQDVQLVSGGPQQGSEDFALVSEQVPSVMLMLGALSEAHEAHASQHNPCVVFNEEALPLGTAIYANCALRWLENN